MLDPLDAAPVVGDGTLGKSIQPEESVIRLPIQVGSNGQEGVGDGVIRYLWSQPSPGAGKYLRVVQIEEFGELLRVRCRSRFLPLSCISPPRASELHPSINISTTDVPDLRLLNLVGPCCCPRHDWKPPNRRINRLPYRLAMHRHRGIDLKVEGRRFPQAATGLLGGQG